MNKKLVTICLGALLVFPGIALAYTPVPEPGGGLSIQSGLDNIVNFVWWCFVAISVVMFISAGILFVTSNGDPGRVKTAKAAVLWGIVGIMIAALSTSIIWVIGSWF
jgi:hypothetical protein